jgi:hypothetical protein
MQQLLRTCLGLAASLALGVAHATPLDVGDYVLGSELATVDSFAATLSSSSAGMATLAFQLVGFSSLDGYDDCCSDILHVSLNGAEVFAGSFNLGGGGVNTITFNPNHATAVATTNGATGDVHASSDITWLGGTAVISLPFALQAGVNTFRFSYSGADQGLADEGWGVSQLEAVTAPVPEPQTYALLLAGLGVGGFVMRTRRR